MVPKSAQRFWEDIQAGDVDAAFTLVDDQATAEIVPAAVRGGKADARAFFDATVTAFPDLLLTEKRSFAGIDGIAVFELKFEGTQGADYLGVVNQEKHIDVDQVWLLGTAEDRITSIRGFWDSGQMYRRLGVKRLDAVSIV